MPWGRDETTRQIIQREVDAYLFDQIDQRLQDLRDLTPVQREQLKNLLQDLEDGTATTAQHQKVTAKLLRMELREPTIEPP